MELPQTSAIDHDWSFHENKEFERYIASDYINNIEDESIRWLTIAKHLNALGWKRTPYEVEYHYKKLARYVEMVESGEISTPDYQDLPENSHVTGVTIEGQSNRRLMIKKGIQWTEDEHKLFLLGLKIYGRGDWRSISRNMVRSRSPSQVASHAQKYFCHSAREKKGKRASIHHTTETDINIDTVRDLYAKGLIPNSSMLKLIKEGVIPPGELENLHPVLDPNQQPDPALYEQTSVAAQIEVAQNEQVSDYYCSPAQLTVSPELLLDELLNDDNVSHNQLQMGALAIVDHNQLRNDTISHSYQMSMRPEEVQIEQFRNNCTSYDQLQTAEPGVYYAEQVSNNDVSHNQLQSVTPPFEALQYEQVGHLNQSQFQMLPADYYGQLSNNFQ